MYDVVIVGARCAGSPTAMLLARAGYRVLLVDRARELRDTLSTFYIQPAGVRLLRSWGVWDPLMATGCPPITRRSFTAAGVTIAGDSELSCAPRRHHLDAVLADAAVQAGAELHLGSTVKDVLFDGRRAVGVRCQTPGGERTIPTRLVIGADGVNSRIAKLVDARTYVQRPVLTCVYYTFWSGITDQFDIYLAPKKGVGCGRTHDDLAFVLTAFPREDFARVRRDPLTEYFANIRDAAPDLYERMADADRVEGLYGTGWQPNYYRRASGPGWALAGDSGHHKDSISAQGITDAFSQAQLLADHINGLDLSDEDRLDDALSAYARVRDELADANFASTLAAAAMDTVPAPEQLRRIAADPDETSKTLSAMGGNYPETPADFGLTKPTTNHAFS